MRVVLLLDMSLQPRNREVPFGPRPGGDDQVKTSIRQTGADELVYETKTYGKSEATVS